MGQSKFDSFLEALANTIVAMTYAVAIYMYFGWTLWQGLSLTAVFAGLGLVRVFTIRRIAEWMSRRKK